jgi:hypothetical protein
MVIRAHTKIHYISVILIPRGEFNAKFSLVLVGLNRNWSISFYLYESSSWWQDAKKME